MKFRNLLELVCIVTLLLGLQKVFAEEAPTENGHEEMVANDSSVDSVGEQEEYFCGYLSKLFPRFCRNIYYDRSFGVGRQDFFHCRHHGHEASKMDRIHWCHIRSRSHACLVCLVWLCNYSDSSSLYLLFVIIPFCCIWNQNAQRRMENVSKRKSISTIRKTPIILLTVNVFIGRSRRIWQGTRRFAKKDAETESPASLETGQSTSQSASMPYKEISRIFIQV